MNPNVLQIFPGCCVQVLPCSVLSQVRGLAQGRAAPGLGRGDGAHRGRRADPGRVRRDEAGAD